MNYNYKKGKIIEIEINRVANDTLRFTYFCPICGAEEVLIVKVKDAVKTMEHIREYNEGKRNIMQINGLETNATAREALISGMCADCQENIFF